MKSKVLYIQQIVGETSDKKEKIELFPSAANPVVVHSYTYNGKRMGGAPTITATIYTDKPLAWNKEEFVEFNGDRFFATYTPNGTKDNSSRMYKYEVTFTSRRELLDNTLFFDVVVDDLDTQNKDRYRSNQTKFTFGGDIYEFVARINSSMAYCGLYRPNDTDKGYYVVIDEGYGTDEVKEVSFEDQYLTDVLQLINTTYELTYYWVGNVCHVGKVQNDLTSTPVKYGRNNELISIAKENANYKIVDMITGYGSSDNLPYYYPNDDEYGKAVYETENFDTSLVTDVDLSKVFKWNPNIYNDTLVLCKTSKSEYEANIIGVSPYLTRIEGGLNFDDTGSGQSSRPKLQNSIDGVKFTSHLGRVSYSLRPGLHSTARIWHFEAYIIAEIEGIPVEGSIDFSKFSFTAKEVDSNLGFKFSYVYKYFVGQNMTKEDVAKLLDNPNLSESGFGRALDGMDEYSESSDKIAPIIVKKKHAVLIECSIIVTNPEVIGDNDNVYAKVTAEPSGAVNYVFKPKSQYYWQYENNTEGYEDSGITINGLDSVPSKVLEFTFDGNKWNGSEGDDGDAAKLRITDRVWISPSQNLMPSIYRESGGAERFYFAKDDTYLLPDGSGKYYTFTNQYKKGNPHQGSVSFDDIKPTINGIRNDVIQENGLGQLFGEIADVAFDSADSDVKDSDSNYIHSYFYIKLHKFSGTYGFDLFQHALASESVKLNLIKSNGCPACSFEIGCHWNADNSKCYNIVSTDGSGNLKSVNTDANDYILDDNSAMADTLNQDTTQKEIWIAVKKDDSTLGIVMPNASAGFKPQKGDLFVLTGINPPKVLVTAAEKRLDEALIKYMSENNEDQFNYSIKFSRIFLQENQDFAKKLNENAKLSIQVDGETNADGTPITHDVFVSDYSVKAGDDILAEVEVSLVNSLEISQSEIKQMVDSVKGETVKQLESLAGGGNGGFNASITDKLYLSKFNDDTAKGKITFEDVAKFVKGLTSESLSRFKSGATFGDFIQGMLLGTGARIDELGNGEFESITSRSSIIAKELIVNRQTAMESNFVFTESGLIEKVTEIPATTEDGNTTYDLQLQQRWDGDFTAFEENDVVLATVNTLASGGGEYYDIWIRVLSVNTVSNTITVVCYPDDECPSGKNNPPCELARLIRWGNAVDEDRQSCWYISSSEGLLVWLDHVTKPIIDKTNYSLAMGKLPDALDFLFKDFPTANKRDGAFYAKWMMAQSFQQVDYEGNPIYTTRDRGVWSLETAKGDKPYRNGDGLIDTVYYLGCKWQCLKDKTTNAPTYSSTDWAFVEGNPYFEMEMLSSNYWSFKLSDIRAVDTDGSYKAFTTLSVVGKLYNQDVTDAMTNVVWTRDSGDVTADNKWAVSHAKQGTSLPLTYEDLGSNAYKVGSVTFTCSAEIKDGETLMSAKARARF